MSTEVINSMALTHFDEIRYGYVKTYPLVAKTVSCAKSVSHLAQDGPKSLFYSFILINDSKRPSKCQMKATKSPKQTARTVLECLDADFEKNR